MSNGLHNQIYNNFDAKETEELLEIWRTNNRVEWSELAFEILEEVLRKRINDLPPQNEPVLDYQDEEDDGLEDWEAKLLDDENQPEFYDTLEVLSLKDTINKLAKAVVVVNIVLGILNFQFVQGLFLGTFPSLPELPGILLSLFATILAVGIEIAVIYFPLKALGHIIRILMEMEFNSRKVNP